MGYVLITGASSGVGRELAIYLSKHYPLIISGRSEDRLEETRAKCENRVIVWPYDLTKIESIDKDLADFIIDNRVEVSAFVHCAGLMKMAPLRSVKLEDVMNTFSTNVFSAEMIIKTLAAKKINSNNLNSVVLISSNISNRGAAAFSVYGASKAALDGIARNLSIELAPNIRVNSVLPGGMITNMTKELFDDENLKKQFEVNYPLGIGTPADIAPIVKFLISDDSRWITGQQITVDGGRTIDITEKKR